MNYLSKANYENICRACLSESVGMKSLFSCDVIMEKEICLREVLMVCASVQIIKDDGLPENICTNCFEEMYRSYHFRKLCEKSESTLRELNNFVSNGQSNFDHYAESLNKIEIVENKQVIKENTLSLFKAENDDSNINNEEYDPGSNEDFDNVIEDEFENDNELVNIEPKGNKSRDCSKEYNEHLSGVREKVYYCDKCNKVFKSDQAFIKHNTKKHSETKDLKENKRKQLPQKPKSGVIKTRNLPRTCDICNKTFRFHSNLERHKLVHSGEKPYLCNVCGKGFAQMSYLKIHSFIHTGEKPYKCEMCNRSFAAPGTLMTHVRTHTGERPHVCKICGKNFPQAGYIAAHMRTHTGEKPVECKVCHRRFNQSGRLITHMRMHSGEKPYSCKDCGRSFAVKGTLKKHIRTHTGERPYVCTICNQAFAQSGTLNTHIKVHKQH